MVLEGTLTPPLKGFQEHWKFFSINKEDVYLNNMTKIFFAITKMNINYFSVELNKMILCGILKNYTL